MKQVSGFYGKKDFDESSPEKDGLKPETKECLIQAYDDVIAERYVSCDKLSESDVLFSTQEAFDLFQNNYPSPFYFRSSVVEILKEKGIKTYFSEGITFWMFRNKKSVLLGG